MKQLFLLLLFVCSIIFILCVGFYPHLSLLLYSAFFGIFVVLFVYTYEVLRVRKQATIKAYYKIDSFLHRYFGHFFLTQIVSFIVALVGSVSLFFMLVFPSGSEILIFCLLVPCSVYGFRLVYIICNANLSPDFAPILAKKYTALMAALLALICEVILNNLTPITLESNDIHTHYLTLMKSYNIAQMHSYFWQELFGFILLKKALLDVLYFSIADSYLHFALILLFACGHFASFASFSLMCVGSIAPKTYLRQNTKNEQETFTLTQSRAFRQFFAMVFFLIFIYIAFNVSIHLQPLAKHHNLPPLLSEQILKENEYYIQISMQGTQSLIRSNDLPSLEHKLKENLLHFESSLNADIEKSIKEYLSQKETIIDEYSKWYFSVRGEYTRLFYAAIGKGEDIAQEQFIFLLKAHTPYDLQERLNRLYDAHFESLKTRLEQSFSFFTLHKNPLNAHISRSISFDDFNQKLDLLNPRSSDGVAALLGASVVGAMILKASGKAITKSGAKVIGKSVAKKSLGGAIGTGGSLLCGTFAPLCAIGFFVASDYAINSVDELINEDEFKQQMREGFDLWELQLKNSLIGYNSQLSKQILEKLSFTIDSQEDSIQSVSTEKENENK